jgi:hypothetical protein
MSTVSQTPIQYQQLRVPRGQGECLIEPALATADDLAQSNRAELSGVQGEIGGKSFTGLRLLARRHLLEEARAYSGNYRSLPAVKYDPAGPIVMAGHQPELFHPGVWFKNMVLSRVGQQLAAPAVNLIIDNDTLAAPAIRVPAGSLAEPRAESVTFDRPTEVIPYEERQVVDHDHFATFAERVRQAGGPMLPGEPIIERLWPTAVEAAREGANVGQAIAQARHVYEESLGLETLEVPLSRVCQGEPFRLFLLHVLTNLAEFREIYNEALAEYRAVHKLRSRSHPAPDLEQVDGFLEAPFWIYSRETPQRGRLYVRSGNNQLELTDRQTAAHHMRLPSDADHSAALEILEACERDGLRLRPRALLTTMFARLFLSDLFLHGIGGAKYDQLTDAIIRRFFGVEPPAYMTATATVYPPLEVPDVKPADLTRLEQMQRELEYHAEQHIDLAQHPAAKASVTAKQQAIAARPPQISPKERHRLIVSANRALQEYVADQRAQLVRQSAELERAWQIRRQIHVREWSFCLFSENFLDHHLLDQTVDRA